MGVILRMVVFMFVPTSVITLSDNMSAFQRKVVWKLQRETLKINKHLAELLGRKMVVVVFVVSDFEVLKIP